MKNLTFCHQFFAARMRTTLFCLTGMLSLNLANVAQGLELQPEEIRGEQNKKPVSVLQNRYFTKAWRPELGFASGTFLNEAYTNTQSKGLHAALFISEWIGIEGQYLETNITNSDDREALNKLSYRKLDEDTVVSPDPEVNRIHKISDANLIFAPFYGKVNLMNQLIVYSDLYFTSGYSKVTTDQGEMNAAIFGLGQRFYWGEAFSLRIDYRDRVYYESRAGARTRKNAHGVDFGFSYFFL